MEAGNGNRCQIVIVYRPAGRNPRRATRQWALGFVPYPRMELSFKGLRLRVVDVSYRLDEDCFHVTCEPEGLRPEEAGLAFEQLEQNGWKLT